MVIFHTKQMIDRRSLVHDICDPPSMQEFMVGHAFNNKMKQLSRHMYVLKRIHPDKSIAQTDYDSFYQHSIFHAVEILYHGLRLFLGTRQCLNEFRSSYLRFSRRS